MYVCVYVYCVHDVRTMYILQFQFQILFQLQFFFTLLPLQYQFLLGNNIVTLVKAHCVTDWIFVMD